MSGDAVHPSQNKDITYRGPPTQASGRRRYSSMEDQRALADLARRNTESHNKKMQHAIQAPHPTSSMIRDFKNNLGKESLTGQERKTGNPGTHTVHTFKNVISQYQVRDIHDDANLPWKMIGYASKKRSEEELG